MRYHVVATKDEGAVPDFLRMDQRVSSEQANAAKTGNWHGWPTKDLVLVEEPLFAGHTDSPLEESGFEPSVPRCAYTAESGAVVRRRLIRAVSGGSSDRRSITRSVC
jgi:hypothetical protein